MDEHDAARKDPPAVACPRCGSRNVEATYKAAKKRGPLFAGDPLILKARLVCACYNCGRIWRRFADGNEQILV